MNFAELLNIAADNQIAAQSEAAVKRYSTTFSAPKKCLKPGVRSEAVQKLLAKKNHEEQQRALAEQRKKEELLASRSQDTKTGKKAKVTASHTKDDFGQFKQPDGKAASQINRESQLGGSTNSVNKNDGAPLQQSHMSYEDILKLASQKQHQPVKFKESGKTDNRPMTEKQKALYDEKRTRVQRTSKKENAISSKLATAKNNSQVSVSQKGKIACGDRASEHQKSAAWKNQKTSVPFHHSSVIPDGKGHSDIKQLPNAVRLRGSGSAQKQISKNGSPFTVSLPNGKVKNATQSTSSVTQVQSHKMTNPGQHVNSVKKVTEDRRNFLPKSRNSVQPGNSITKVINEAALNNRTLGTKPELIKRPNVPSVKKPSGYENKSQESKPFHMNPYMDAPLQLHEPENFQKKQLKRRFDSDDDMSDFIDDESCNGNIDYSKHIKEIFRSNRTQHYDDDDDDDENMETSYADQMKEEKRSAKLGYLEDLEDIRKEKEEKKKEKELKKKEKELKKKKILKKKRVK